MADSLNLQALPPQAQKVLAPTAPAPAKMMAAKGIIPGLKPGDIASVVYGLSLDGDEKVAAAAGQTLRALPPPILAGALQSDLQAPVVDAIARGRETDAEVVEQLLRMRQIGEETLARLAAAADERCGELIATNQQLMLAHPMVIEKLYMNPRVRMSTANRLIELAVRNGVELGIPAFREAAEAIQSELIPEPSDEPSPDDEIFDRTAAIAEEVGELESEEDDTHEVDDEGEERVKKKYQTLQAELEGLKLTEKIRRAMLGTSAELMLLVRSPNKLVAEAAVKSPKLKDRDAVRISASRSVSDSVLRILARKREFLRIYQVKLNLVSNPRTPLSFSSRLVPHLRDADLRSLSRSRNIPGPIAQAVRQQVLRKKR